MFAHENFRIVLFVCIISAHVIFNARKPNAFIRKFVGNNRFVLFRRERSATLVLRVDMFRRTNIIASSTETESAGNKELCLFVTKEACNYYTPHPRE